MRSVRAIVTCACCFGFIVGCGRAQGDGSKGSGGMSAAQGGAEGGGAPVHAGGVVTGGAPEGGAGNGGVSGGDADGGALASSGSSGSDAAGADNPCGADNFFVKLNGELPGGFGMDQALTFGCPDARPGAFAVPVSFTRPPPENGGLEIGIVACDGGALAVRLDQSLAFHQVGGFNSLSYAVDRAWRSLDITELSISEQPVVDWTTLGSGSSDGVGKVYAGSFRAQGALTGSPISVTGSFRVCHVANLNEP